MRTSTAVVLFVAILIGGIAALMARSIIGEQQVAPKTTIVVAKQPSSFGPALSRDNLEEQAWGADAVPEGSFTSIDDLTKDGARVAMSQIGRNEPIVKSRITDPGQKASLSTLLEPGMRAVTVRVDDVRGVAGFVMPGDHVDIALTRDDRQKYTDILLQNVKVLAIDQLAGERQERAQVAKAVTLEVTREQGQKLILAAGAGSLSLSLRQVGGPEKESPRRVTLEDLGQTETVDVVKPEPEKVVAKPQDEPVAKPELPPVARVQIIRGVRPEGVDVYRER
jgi:pilus assembly protein CpaB